MRRLWLVSVVLAALVSGGCWYEERDGEVWACDSVTGANGEVFTGCQPTGVRISHE